MGPNSIAASMKSVFSKAPTESPPASVINSTIDDDDDEESLFIYARVADLPQTFYSSDAISACLFTNECHCYATHGGIVHLRTPSGTPIRTVRVHRASVLSMSASSNYIATASIDGTVVIASITDALDTVQASFRRPVHCVALHPDYKNYRSYISGGTAGEVVLSEKGWLKSRSDTVLAHTQSTILAVAWTATLGVESRVIWCNEDGVSIYCPERKIAINRISRAQGIRADLYRPRIYVTDKNAIVAWARTIYIIDLSKGTLISQQELPFVVSGVSTHESGLALLSVDPHTSTAELRLRSMDGNELYTDELDVNKKQKLTSNDFHLGSQNNNLFIVAPNDAIMARERTNRDHVEWLCERERYVEAYGSLRNKKNNDESTNGIEKNTETATKNNEEDAAFTEEEIRDIGVKAAQQLMEMGSYTTCAQLLPEILEPTDKDWILFGALFLSHNEHIALGDVLPPTAELSDLHNDVLQFAVDHNNSAHLQKWIKRWPLDVFNGNALASKLTLLSDELDQDMLCAYAELLLKLSEFVKAVEILVKADSPRAFLVAKHYHLWPEVKIQNILDQVLTSGGGDGQYLERLRELIKARAEIKPSRVVKQLQSSDNDLLLFGYLTELGIVDEQELEEFADLMIEMYIRYDRTKLLSFLEKTNGYNISKTMDLCRKTDPPLISELVYLMGKIGQASEALNLIVTELKDFKRATQFAASCAASQGNEIWDELIQYCKTEPELVLELLKRVEVSPAAVLQVVPADMRIKGLKKALMDVFKEQDMSLELAKGVRDIVATESRHWTRALRAKRSEGTSLENPELIFVDGLKPPVLISDGGHCVAVPEFTRPVQTFSDKIAHYIQVTR